jgi:excisionase family DNA binding protein
MQSQLILENLCTKKQLAEKLSFSVSYVNKLMTQGLPRITSGRAVRFRYSEVMQWLEQRST